ncbi:MAG: adenylate/guanylate cyclase domain-containing protein [Phycisphaeraceae bacterium]
MLAARRKFLFRTGLIGFLLTLLAATMLQAGLLDGLENWCYDRRARDCQFFVKPSNNRLVHLLIDDNAVATIDRWPWPRTILAQVIDELRLAGSGPVALDITFPEAQKPEFVPQADGTYTGLDHDAALAEAISRHGNVILAVSLKPDTQPLPEPPFVSMVGLLRQDLEMDREMLRQKLEAQGADRQAMGRVDAFFVAAQTRAMASRIRQELAKAPATLEELQVILLPHMDPALHTHQRGLLEKEYPIAMALVKLERLGRADTVAADPAGPPILSASEKLPPIALLIDAAAAVGTVNDVPSGDGVVRRMPMFMREGDRLYPQLGFALACRMLEVSPNQVRIHADRLVIPDARGDLVLPIHTQTVGQARRRAGTLFNIPWVGKAGEGEWPTIYDVPEHQREVAMLSVNAVWMAIETQRALRRNHQLADQALRDFYAAHDTGMLKGLTPLPDDEAQQRLGRIAAALATATEWGYLDAYGKLSNEQVRQELSTIGDPAVLQRTRGLINAVRMLPRLHQEIPALQKQLIDRRTHLRVELAGKAVLVGATATSALDFVPTPMHPRCPGVIAHGLVYNAIMTGEMWRVAPPWITLAITIAIGLGMTVSTTLLPPSRALFVLAAVGIVYWVINGVVLFDWGNLIVGVAGPMSAALLVWPGCTLTHFVAERRERARITDRFRNYVDPALVNYVIENPDRAHLDGETRELTIVFTDLQGFTAASEKLGADIVPLLNDYMGKMVPVIRKNHGYVNKFLGDGIMFFFGAPRENPDHALSAMLAVMQMQAVMVPFNEGLSRRGLPPLITRAGVNTGTVIVGDAGSGDASDYTVLGDQVNLASRLESANKLIGTRVLISQRTAELIGDAVLLRPIARLQVYGKTEHVLVHEPLALKQSATPQQRELADATRAMFDAYVAGDFAATIIAADALDQRFGQGSGGAARLTAIYRDLARQYQQQPPIAFDGVVHLTEK